MVFVQGVPKFKRKKDKLSPSSKRSESLFSTNSFDDDYDEEMNPFWDEEELDDSYDRNLNPFE